MKKRVLMGVVLLIAIGTSAVFAQSQARYYLEIYNISQATYNRLRNSSDMREDDYFFARTASGTTVRSKEKNLTLDQVSQKLRSLDPSATGLDKVIPAIQQRWGASGTLGGGTSPTIYFWVRRTE